MTLPCEGDHGGQKLSSGCNSVAGTDVDKWAIWGEFWLPPERQASLTMRWLEFAAGFCDFRFESFIVLF